MYHFTVVTFFRLIFMRVGFALSHFGVKLPAKGGTQMIHLSFFKKMVIYFFRYVGIHCEH